VQRRDHINHHSCNPNLVEDAFTETVARMALGSVWVCAAVCLGGVLAASIPPAKLPVSGFPVSDSAPTTPPENAFGPNSNMQWAQFRYPSVVESLAFMRSWASRAPHVARFDTCQRRYKLEEYNDCSGQDISNPIPCEQGFMVITHWPSWRGYEASPPHVWESQPFTVPTGSPNAHNRSLERPQVLISGSVHGDEQVGPVTSLALIELLLKNYVAAESWEARCGVGSPECDAERRRLVEDDGPMDEAAIRSRLRRLSFTGASLPFNPWLKRLVDTRVLVVLPMANPDGYANMRREEMVGSRRVDPNRDFSYDPTDAASCMVTMTARCINELFREHLFQSMITFHGGDESITYEWGTARHTQSLSEAPDDVSQSSVAKSLQQYGGLFASRSYYRVGRMNSVMYAVNGGLEDWSYAGSWDLQYLQQCNPQSYGGYARSRTVYDDSVLRCSTFLVETALDKRPDEVGLGYWGPSLLAPSTSFGSEGPSSVTAGLPSGRDTGHIPRNLRLSLALLDLVEPYAQSLSLTTNVARQSPSRLSNSASLVDWLHPLTVMDFPEAGNPLSNTESFHRVVSLSSDDDKVTVQLEWDVGGAHRVDESGVMVIHWPLHAHPDRLFEAAGLASVGPVANETFEGALRLVLSDAAATSARAVSDAVRLYLSDDSDALFNASTSISWAGLFHAVRTANGRPWPPYDVFSNASDAGRYVGLQNLMETPVFGQTGLRVRRVSCRGSECSGGWSSAAVQQADRASRPFERRMVANVTLFDPHSDVLPHLACARDTDKSVGVCRDEQDRAIGAGMAVVVVPYVVSDSQWRTQRTPTPALPPQSHLANARTDPSWRRGHNGFTVRGRAAFTGSASFVAVVDRRRETVERCGVALQAITDATVLVPGASASPSPASLPEDDEDDEDVGPGPRASFLPAQPPPCLADERRAEPSAKPLTLFGQPIDPSNAASLAEGLTVVLSAVGVAAIVLVVLTRKRWCTTIQPYQRVQTNVVVTPPPVSASPPVMDLEDSDEDSVVIVRG
jgi:hypothetical protein